MDYGTFNPRPMTSGRIARVNGELVSSNAITGGGEQHTPTFTCAHCNTMVLMNPQRRRERHVCARCRRVTCDRPGCLAECNPTDEAIELCFANPRVQQPFVGRAPDGTILFDPALRDRRRIH
jgi:hypothetical protein